MHGGENQPRVGHLALDVTWPVIPVDTQRLDRARGAVLGGQELHDPRQVIWLTRRFTNEVYVV